jgi:hypothetical protein
MPSTVSLWYLEKVVCKADLSTGVGLNSLSTRVGPEQQVTAMSQTGRDVVSLLNADDAVLRNMFMDVLKHHHKELRGKLDTIFILSDKWCKSGDHDHFDELEDYLESLMPNEHILVCFCVDLVGRGAIHVPSQWLRDCAS